MRFTLTSAKALFRRFLTLKGLLIIGSLTITVLTITATINWLFPRTINFSYSQKNCFTNIVVLPNLVKSQASNALQASLDQPFKILGFNLLSRSTCLHLIQPPLADTRETIFLTFGSNSSFGQRLIVKLGKLPALANQPDFGRTISTTAELSFQLNQPDTIFHYQLSSNDLAVKCAKLLDKLTCPAAPLKLAQAKPYNFKLVRLFNDSPQNPVWQADVTTVAPVIITASDITADQTIYTIPTNLKLTINRPAQSVGTTHLYQMSGSERLSEVPVTTSLSDQTVTILLSQPLPRSASLSLVVDNVLAADGGHLDSPYWLNFKTSGGPKVTNINIPATKLAVSSTLVITFDSPLLANQSAKDFVRLESATGVVATTAVISGNKISLKPTTPLPTCTPLTVKVIDGIKNEAGISGGSAWEFKTRSICQVVYGVGSSVEGRGITAYQFGTGPSKMLFIGGTHGNEKSSVYTLNSWVDYLETHYSQIPANRTIVVVPNINPDGFAANRRTNSHNVDLNRNFPANDWKSGVTMPDHSYLDTGGGSAPLSEPESSAIANLVNSLQPRLVMTYHATAGVVLPNDAGDSASLAANYDRLSNVRLLSNSTGYFGYDTTGAFEGWLHDKLNITTLLVELFTYSSNEFNSQTNAMWSMVQIP